MALAELMIWEEYHVTEGLPDLQHLFADMNYRNALLHGDPKQAHQFKFENFMLRPQQPKESPTITTPLSPDDTVDYLRRLYARRIAS